MIPPGATVGVFGSGQLGRMFTVCARRMGYRVHVYSPEASSPAGTLADREFVGDYQDEASLDEFCQTIDVATFEFENVPAGVTDVAERYVPVRPGGHVLHVCQNRLREKGTLAKAGLPVPPFAAVRSADDLPGAIKRIGTPAIMKTATSGYDGKGQVVVRSEDEAAAAWKELGTGEAIFEALVPFEKELSVIGARGIDGEIAVFPVFENEHSRHILDLSRCPGRVAEPVARDAIEIARCVLETLNVVGVLCVEMFLLGDNSLLINELAPRPHNSGHLTIEASATSQFEQQLRAVAGLPLGSTAQRRPAAMANILGETWNAGEPRWGLALDIPEVALHLYGKDQPTPGRKMGHLTALADDVDSAAAAARRARRLLRPPTGPEL